MPNDEDMTAFVGVGNMVRWVRATGVERVLTGLVEYLEADFVRWQSFEKSPRVANHTPFGVIELMPVADDHRCILA